MNLSRLAATNLFRNPLRSVLTMLGVSIAVVTFLLLRTVIWAWNVAADEAVPDRVVTRHKVTFIMTLPKRYVEEVRAIDGVRAATWGLWWGGREPNHTSEFFATLAVDPDTWFEVYEEMIVPPEDIAAWREDRQGIIVGDLLAQKFGWEKGETVTLESTIYPGDWQFRVKGIYVGTRKTVDRQTVMLHWDYFNEQASDSFKEQVGWIVSRTSGVSPTEVGKRIDAKFYVQDIQTVSQDEATFQRSFLAGFSMILLAINFVSGAILLILGMILGNTVAMGVRERIPEYGVLRAIGFLPRHLVALVVGEAVTLGILGGLLGLALGYLLVNLLIGRWLEENISGFFPYFNVTPPNAVLAMVLSIALAVLASAFPAFRASRLRVVDALRRVG